MKSCAFFVVALYVAYTHGWTSDDDVKGRGLVRGVPPKDLNESIQFAEDVFQRLELREQILGSSETEITSGSPSHEQFIESFPELEALSIMNDTLIITHSSGNVAFQFCSDLGMYGRACAEDLQSVSLLKTPLWRMCQRISKECTQEQILSSYRSFDGSCNNGEDGDRGQTFTIYRRLLQSGYIDGISQLRRSVTKEELPSPQVVSSELVLDTSLDNQRSLAVLYWAQFVEHDMSHTAMSRMMHTGKKIECCNREGTITNPRYVHPFCLLFRVSPQDAYYQKKHITCLSYSRSIAGIGPNCALGTSNQLNQASHFLDASQIYGISEEKQKNLRTFKNGLLSVFKFENLEFLPLSKDAGHDCPSRPKQKLCFQSGDKRVNGNYYITSLYTIWHREHNRIAKKLAQINPEWDDETIFQEARRIVIAEIQHITYSEWIPEVLGLELNDPYVMDGNSVVSNEFATAAIRALQEAAPGRLSKTEDQKKNRIEKTKSIETLLKEMASLHYSGRTLSYFGKIPSAAYGIDLLGFDIHRGRDHGLASYNEYREFCGLEKADNFQDLFDTILPNTVESLQHIYKDVDDIDLIAGGIAEIRHKGLLGPTLSCILKEQFKKTREGDRYFYTNKDQPKPFSESQLEEIKKVTFARIICDNTKNLRKIQRYVFQLPNNKNVEEDCKSDVIPSLDLNLWNHKRYFYNR